MMEYEKSEIEKLIICLKDTDNVINTFPLERQKQGESIIWKFEDEGFYIEIITDEAIRTVEKITKSDTIVESIDEIRHHFLDVVFETKMNQLINIEDGFDDADEEEAIMALSGVQVIVETHSEHVLNGIRIAALKNAMKPEDISINFFSVSVCGAEAKHKVENIPLNDRMDLEAWPEGFLDQEEEDLKTLRELRRR